jgi:A118 family predicted phage portal protein
MPLPQSDSAWPPANIVPAYDLIEVFDAWLTGDISQLETLYMNMATQYKGGLWGGIRRMFWGSPNPAQTTQPPVKLHAPIAAEVARMSSSLLYGEMFSAKFEDDHDNDDKTATGAEKPQTVYDLANARIAELLDDNAHARFLECGEYQSAHGGAYIKIAWDKQTHPAGPFLQVMAADTAVPEFRFGQLVAVTFWTQLASIKGVSYRLLERHEPGSIEYGLYESSSKGMLGVRQPLAVHPDAAVLIGLVNENSQIETGSELITARYFPNLKPNRGSRKDPVAVNFGRSDYDGAEDLMDAFDEVFTSLMRDIRLGKSRIMVPKGLLNVLAPGQGAQFDADQEIFTELGEMVGSKNPNGTAGTAESFITTFQPAIRYNEHVQSMVHLLERIYAACGYSAQTFGEAGDVAVTATEVTSREKLTILTRASKIVVVRPEISLLLAALMDVDEFAFSGPGRNDILPNIEFSDAASENPEVLARTLQLLNLSESTSIKTRVTMLHPDWDEEQIDIEVAAIRADLAIMPVPLERGLWAAEGGPVGDPNAPPSDLKVKPGQPGYDPATDSASAGAKP